MKNHPPQSARENWRSPEALWTIPKSHPYDRNDYGNLGALVQLIILCPESSTPTPAPRTFGITKPHAISSIVVRTIGTGTLCTNSLRSTIPLILASQFYGRTLCGVLKLKGSCEPVFPTERDFSDMLAFAILNPKNSPFTFQI
jgi:hypothetical protein